MFAGKLVGAENARRLFIPWLARTGIRIKAIHNPIAINIENVGNRFRILPQSRSNRIRVKTID